MTQNSSFIGFLYVLRTEKMYYSFPNSLSFDFKKRRTALAVHMYMYTETCISTVTTALAFCEKKKKKPIEIPPFSIIQVSSFHSFYSFLSQRKLVVFLFPKLHRRFIIYVWKKKDKKTHRLYFGNLTDFLVSNILRWFFYI